MTDIVLDKITSGYNLSKINKNFEKVEDVINDEVIHSIGGNNVMKQDLDMNGKALLNVKINPSDEDSLLTVKEADKLYYNVKGDKLEGSMDIDGNDINNLNVPTKPHQPVRKDMLDSEVAARTAADVSLQQQLNGVNPPMASAFSPISWHDQVINNSVNIPANKNAWSFGPRMTIAAGQTVTIGNNSSWTIANGAPQN